MLGALILTGGRSSRMGEDKAVQLWGGRRAVDLAAALAGQVGATVILTVGGREYGYPFVGDPTPGGGPVGGVAAGAGALAAAGCRRALVLAVDAPTVTPEDLAPLLAAPSPGATYAAFPLPMVADIARLPPEARPDWPLARLAERAGLAELACAPDRAARLRGANTPAERERLLARLPRAPAGRAPGR